MLRTKHVEHQNWKLVQRSLWQIAGHHCIGLPKLLFWSFPLVSNIQVIRRLLPVCSYYNSEVVFDQAKEKVMHSINNDPVNGIPIWQTQKFGPPDTCFLIKFLPLWFSMSILPSFCCCSVLLWCNFLPLGIIKVIDVQFWQITQRAKPVSQVACTPIQLSGSWKISNGNHHCLVRMTALRMLICFAVPCPTVIRMVKDINQRSQKRIQAIQARLFGTWNNTAKIHVLQLVTNTRWQANASHSKGSNWCRLSSSTIMVWIISIPANAPNCVDFMVSIDKNIPISIKELANDIALVDSMQLVYSHTVTCPPNGFFNARIGVHRSNKCSKVLHHIGLDGHSKTNSVFNSQLCQMCATWLAPGESFKIACCWVGLSSIFLARWIDVGTWGACCIHGCFGVQVKNLLCCADVLGQIV